MLYLRTTPLKFLLNKFTKNTHKHMDYLNVIQQGKERVKKSFDLKDMIQDNKKMNFELDHIINKIGMKGDKRLR